MLMNCMTNVRKGQLILLASRIWKFIILFLDKLLCSLNRTLFHPYLCPVTMVSNAVLSCQIKVAMM